MSMKPRLGDSPKQIPGVVTGPTAKAEQTNIPGTVTTSKTVTTAPISGTVTAGGKKG